MIGATGSRTMHASTQPDREATDIKRKKTKQVETPVLASLPPRHPYF